MKPDTYKKCKVIIFSDIHYALERPVNNGSDIDRKLTQYAVPLVNKLVDRINEIKPDLVVNLGDLIEDSGDRKKDLVDLQFVWSLLKNIKVPFYSLIGNHDLRAMSSRKEVEQIMGYDNAVFSVDIKGYHFVFLSSDINNQIGAGVGGILRTQFVSATDIKWLENDLQLNTLPYLVFSHFGIAADEMKGNYWFGKDPQYAVLGNHEEVKNILKDKVKPLAVFSGHQHWTKQVEEDGINYYVIGSLTEDMNNNGIPDGVYLEVDLDGKNIHITERHLNL